MKSCVVTANYACDPNKVWLYLTKPTLNPAEPAGLLFKQTFHRLLRLLSLIGTP